MELSSANFACIAHGSKSYYFGRALHSPFMLRMDHAFSITANVVKWAKQQVVAQVFENEATQSSRTMNEHDLRGHTSIRKDCDPLKIEANGKINGATHCANHKMISTKVGGNEDLKEKGKIEGIMAQEGQGNGMYNVEDCSFLGPGKVDLEARNQASRGATRSTVEDVTTNGYLGLTQGLYKQGHQPPTPMLAKNGLGIVEFLRGKKILITGATGFLAKVLVEKILRVQPDMEHLFLLIKADNVDHAKARLQNEIVHSSLFKNLQDVHGEYFQDFMESKLSPIVGNLAKDTLGMDAKTTSELQGKVDIIVNSAASTTFDERYDYALNLNTKGAERVTKFANNCLKLELLMHVSTAFVNGERKGVVKERIFKSGCSIANELSSKGEDIVPDIDVDKEIQLVNGKIDDTFLGIQRGATLEDSSLDKDKMEKALQQAMKDFGMKR